MMLAIVWHGIVMVEAAVVCDSKVMGLTTGFLMLDCHLRQVVPKYMYMPLSLSGKV